MAHLERRPYHNDQVTRLCILWDRLVKFLGEILPKKDNVWLHHGSEWGLWFREQATQPGRGWQLILRSWCCPIVVVLWCFGLFIRGVYKYIASSGCVAVECSVALDSCSDKRGRRFGRKFSWVHLHGCRHFHRPWAHIGTSTGAYGNAFGLDVGLNFRCRHLVCAHQTRRG